LEFKISTNKHRIDAV